MTTLEALCLSATPFTTECEIDEEAFRAFLHRFVDSRVGIYLGSGSSGERHAMVGRRAPPSALLHENQ